MITTYDVLDSLWARLNASALKTDPVKHITGVIARRRPMGSIKEDVIINTLPIDNNQLQFAVANINIYVPAMVINTAGNQDTIPNYERLEELTEMAITAVDDVVVGEIHFKVQQQELVDEDGEFYSNIRVEIYNINTN